MAPRIHHLNCATMCPVGERLLGGEGSLTGTYPMVAHVLLIESSDGLILVDTGLGSGDIANPARTGGLFRHMTRPRFEIEETALEQVKALGHSPADVRHICVTHLDVDHAGGLGDFPGASVHLFATELEAALRPGIREKLRYIQAQWAHGPKWVEYSVGGDSWYGFDSVRAIEGVDPEIAIVPLVGHTRGHSAIAVRDGDRWLMHCGDGYFHRGEIQRPPAGTKGLAIFQTMVEIDRRDRLANQERLRELNAAHGEEIDIFCAHDKVEFERHADG